MPLAVLTSGILFATICSGRSAYTYVGEWMRVLYLDVLVMLNTIIDYFALKISCELCGKSIRNVRIAIASAAGGVLSLLILLEMPSNTAGFALKLISSAIVSLIAVGLGDSRSAAKITVSMFLISMLICGAAYALSRNSNHNIFLNNCYIYLDISPVTLLLALALSYALLSALESFFPETGFRDIVNIEIEIRGNSVRSKALVDSGNLLKSTVDGKRVAIVSHRLADHLIADNAMEMLSAPENFQLLFSEGYHIRFVPYSTLDGRGTMIGVCCKIHILSAAGKQKAAYEMVAVFRELAQGRDDIGAIIGKII